MVILLLGYWRIKATPAFLAVSMRGMIAS
jgi:hypothetical protein